MTQLRWLVALEAGLFFSAVCWETTATWAAPTYGPVPFALALVGAATAGMLTCHVGPAFYASRFAVPGWVMAWLAFGYLEWLWGIGDTEWTPGGWTRFAMAAVLALARPIWRAGAAFSLALGVGVLGWALRTQWHGIWATNPRYGSGPETIFDLFTPGVLLAAAPAVVVASRIGQLRPGAKAIWWSGFWGVWLPAVTGIGVASVASDAGGTLHWTPTLFRGFYWALQGAERLNATAVLVSSITILAPAIVSVWALRELWDAWPGRRVFALVPIGLWAAVWVIRQAVEPEYGLTYPFHSVIHRWWAWGVVALGAAGGWRALSCLPLRWATRTDRE